MGLIVLDDSIVKSNSINSTDKLVYGVIKVLTNNKGYCYASNDYISKKVNLSKRTISKSISNLRKANYIRVEIINYQRNIYLTNNE